MAASRDSRTTDMQNLVGDAITNRQLSEQCRSENRSLACYFGQTTNVGAHHVLAVEV